jgi:radical SAM-linked protein
MRLRITFSKNGTLRYTGHLDLQTVFERTARRAALPLAYTHGFHPGPKIQIASALPLGYAGCAEVIDMWTDTDPGDFAEVQKRLQAGSPPGLTILRLEAVDEHAPALQTQVTSAEYMVTLLEAGYRSELEHFVEDLLAAASLPRVRRDKAYDLRPLIEELSILPLHLSSSTDMGGEVDENRVRIFMRLAARTGATGRPEEVLELLGIPSENTRIERTRLIFINGIKLIN